MDDVHIDMWSGLLCVRDGDSHTRRAKASGQISDEGTLTWFE